MEHSKEFYIQQFLQENDFEHVNLNTIKTITRLYKLFKRKQKHNNNIENAYTKSVNDDFVHPITAMDIDLDQKSRDVQITQTDQLTASNYSNCTNANSSTELNASIKMDIDNEQLHHSTVQTSTTI